MKRLVFFSLLALGLIAAVSCRKEFPDSLEDGLILSAYKDLPAVYQKILENKKKLTCPANTVTVWVDMQTQIDHIGDIVNAVK